MKNLWKNYGDAEKECCLALFQGNPERPTAQVITGLPCGKVLPSKQQQTIKLIFNQLIRNHSRNERESVGEDIITKKSPPPIKKIHFVRMTEQSTDDDKGCL